MRLIGRLLLGLILLVGVAVAGSYGYSALRLTAKMKVPETQITLRSDSATLLRGHKLATAMGKCQDCHGQDMAGRVMIKEKKFAYVIAPNLTGGSGSRVASWTPELWDRAIRHGVGPDGTKLAIMPAEAYQYLTDEDLGALVTYLQSLPEVDNTPEGRTTIGPIARSLYLAGKMPLFAAEHVKHDSVGKRQMPEGQYLAYTSGCHACHGPQLKGGPMIGGPPDAPPPTNIGATGMPGWSEANFMKAMRTGIRPDGTKIDDFMPWVLTGQLTDGELSALWNYMRSVGA